MNAEAVHPFWVKRDREGYIEYCLRHLTTAAGIKPTRPVASRWFNLMTIISETAGDFWVHREKDQLWWTRSKSDAPTIVPGIDPTMAGNPKVYVCHKPCEPWSNFTKSGNRLEWNGLHARAKEFLFTEGKWQDGGVGDAINRFEFLLRYQLPCHRKSLVKGTLQRPVSRIRTPKLQRGFGIGV
jgi:hypothetical protein